MERRQDRALQEWEALQPQSVTGDSVWRLDCYRESLFILHLARGDVVALDCQSAPREARDQLVTALASISANLAEGFGRSTNADRLRFLSYSIGSAREAVIWYQAVLPLGADSRLADRLERLEHIKRMLLGLIGRLREKTRKPFEPW